MHFRMNLFNLYPSVSDGRLKGKGEGDNQLGNGTEPKTRISGLPFRRLKNYWRRGILVHMYLYSTVFYQNMNFDAVQFSVNH